MFENMYAIYGAGGFGREVMALARENLRISGADTTELVFVDDNITGPEINGHRVLQYTEFLTQNVKRRHVAIAVANSVIRDGIASRCTRDGVLPWSIAARNSVVLDDVRVGSGSIICPFVTLTSNIRIGNYFHANAYSYVMHDCIIGDYVTFAPAVRCNGNIVIEDHAYVGAGALIKQGLPGRPLTIGRGAVVGMGAVVTKDVPAGVTVVGNPARVM